MKFQKIFPFCWSFLPFWIRIRIPNTDPDPMTLTGSGSETLLYTLLVVWYPVYVRCRYRPVAWPPRLWRHRRWAWRPTLWWRGCGPLLAPPPLSTFHHPSNKKLQNNKITVSLSFFIAHCDHSSPVLQGNQEQHRATTYSLKKNCCSYGTFHKKSCCEMEI